MEETLKNACLPDKTSILDQAQKVMMEIDELDVQGPLSDHYRAICGSGAICFGDLREVSGTFSHPKWINEGLRERLPLPKLGFSDGDLGQFFGTQVMPANQQEELVAYEHHLLHDVEDFVSACR